MIRLTRREKILAGGLVVFAAAWSVFAVGVRPALARVETLNRVIFQKQQELEKVRAKTKEYIFLRDSLDNLRTKIASQQRTFELLPFLESLIEECGLSKKVSSMNQHVLEIDSDYSETIVEIRLENLSLGNLVDFLCRVESSHALARTKSLYIRKDATNKDLLDSVIEIRNAKLSQS